MKTYKGDIDVSGKFIKRFPEWLSEIILDGDFRCHRNLLTSLEGAPEAVLGDFYCHNNKVEFTEEQVRDVCDVGGEVYVLTYCI